MFSLRRALPNFTRAAVRTYSDAAAAPAVPPLVKLLRNDMKSAMRAKQTARLTSIRSILSTITNAGLNLPTGPAPLTSDSQVLPLLTKSIRSIETSIEEAKAAGREDIVAKEQEGLEVMKEYLGKLEVEVVGRDEVLATVKEIAGELGVKDMKGMGNVVKGVMGKLGSKGVEGRLVAEVVKEVLSGKA